MGRTNVQYWDDDASEMVTLVRSLQDELTEKERRIDELEEKLKERG